VPEDVTYDVIARTVFPLHIGTGNTLLKDFDYVVHGGRTWRLNVDALLEEKIQDERHADMAARTAPGTLLSAADYIEGSPLFRYILPGEPRAAGEGAQLLEQLKDPWDRPFLPGSSLKGALRTALLWCAAQEADLAVTANDLDRRAAWAAQPIEQGLFRQGSGREGSPNYDLLRALQVGDSEPLDSSALTIVNASVIGGRRQPSFSRGTGAAEEGAPIELEAVRHNVRFHCRIKIDSALFSRWARERGLRMAREQAWLEDLPRLVQRHSANLAERALGWCSENVEDPLIIQYYEQIRRYTKENGCFVQVGWGGGWDSKTLGGLLQQDPQRFEEIASKYHLRRGRGGASSDMPFPRTRRMWVNDDDGTVRGPLGWLQLTFTRRS